jgi:hypothetical protein
MFEELIKDLVCRYDVILCKMKENSPFTCVCTTDTLGRNVIMTVGGVCVPNNHAISKWLHTQDGCPRLQKSSRRLMPSGTAVHGCKPHAVDTQSKEKSVT